jgi:hypothetical protein
MSDPNRDEPEKRLSEPEKMKATVPASISSAKTPAPPDAKRNPAKSGVVLPAVAEKKSGLQRAIGFVRTIAPFVQRALPLLDGNVASAVSNILAPRVETHQVNLEPIENAMTKMRKDHLELRLNLADQTTALKRVADQVGTLKDATERNALEQKGLAQDLQNLRSKVGIATWVGIGLLVISIVINILLFLRIQQLVH